MTASLYLLLALFFPFAAFAENDICNLQMCGEKFKFWLATTRNSKNQWVAETGLEHPKKYGKPGWKLQVENESTNCYGEDYCRIVASLTVACPEISKDGYRSYETGRYKLYNINITWDEAKKACEKDGAHLAIIDSQMEVEVLKEVVKTNQYSYTWIGYSDKEKEGVHVDIFGKPVKNFWAKNQPDDWKNSEDCGSITKEGLMNDGGCPSKLNYICEKPN